MSTTDTNVKNLVINNLTKSQYVNAESKKDDELYIITDDDKLVAVSKLENLQDVTITNPSNNEVLKYDTTSGKWINDTDTVGSSSQPVYLNNGTITECGSSLAVSITGNAATATKLATASTISLTGSVTGSGSFDGSGNLSITTSTNHTHSYAGSSSAGGAANSVANSLILKVNTGTTEGTNLYTFNGSGTKTLDIKSGSNVTLTAGSGTLTIAATDTTYTAGDGIDITNNVISNTRISAEWGNITGDISSQSDLNSALNSKQNTLSTAQLNAVNSGITSAKVSTYDGYATILAKTVQYDTDKSGNRVNKITLQDNTGKTDSNVAILNLASATSIESLSQLNRYAVNGSDLFNETRLNANGTYISDANTVATNVKALDTQVKSNKDSTITSFTQSGTTINANTSSSTTIKVADNYDWKVTGGSVTGSGTDKKIQLTQTDSAGNTDTSVEIDVSDLSGSIVSGSLEAEGNLKKSIVTKEGKQVAVFDTIDDTIYNSVTVVDDRTSPTGSGKTYSQQSSSVITVGHYDTDGTTKVTDSSITKNTLTVNGLNYITTDGINANSNKIINVANAVNNNDATNYTQLKGYTTVNVTNSSGTTTLANTGSGIILKAGDNAALSVSSNEVTISSLGGEDTFAVHYDKDGGGAKLNSVTLKDSLGGTDTSISITNVASAGTLSSTNSNVASGSDIYNATTMSSAGNYYSANASTTTAIKALDTQIKTNTTNISGKADKATTLSGYGITNAYTKTEVDSKVASVFRYKGSVTTTSNLPTTGQSVGDVYNVQTADSTKTIVPTEVKAGDNVCWTGSEWDVLAGTIDLTNYYTKTETNTELGKKQNTLSTAQLNAVNSGITSAKVSTYDGYATTIAGKVDKVDGKGLSTNDYTTTEKTKLAGIATGATNVTTSTVSGWGYTKNTGTITGITMNGSSKGTSGVVDLGTVITDISGKADKATTLSGYGITDAYTKTQTDTLLDNKQNVLLSGDNIIIDSSNKISAIDTITELTAGDNISIENTECEFTYTDGLTYKYSELLASFLKKKGATGYNAQYDLNNDGVVNLTDGGIFDTMAKEVGATYTYKVSATDTTYTGSDGILLTGTNFTNSGVRSVTQSSTDGYITVNTGGTTTDIKVVAVYG